MQIDTFLNYNTELPFTVKAITTATLNCPHCKQLVKYILPDVEIKHYSEERMRSLEQEINRLHLELKKMEIIFKVNNAIP